MNMSSKALYEGRYPGDDVARRLPVRDFWYKEPWTGTREKYFMILERCAGVGNLDAFFLLGMEQVYSFGNYQSGINYLSKASSGHHEVATYAMGILLVSDPSTRSNGMELLARLSKDNIKQCRIEVASIVRDIGWRWRAANMAPCTNPSCVVKPEDDWGHHSFCGLLCRLRYECDRTRWVSTQWREWIRCPNSACGRAEAGLGGRFCSEQCRWRDEYLKFHKLV